MSTGVVADGRLVAKPFVTPAAIVVTENYIVMLIYDENSEPAFVAACQPFNANVLLMENSFSFSFFLFISFFFSFSSFSFFFPLSAFSFLAHARRYDGARIERGFDSKIVRDIDRDDRVRRPDPHRN